MADEDDNKFTIEFAPGCFDDFDGTQEELDELIAELQQKANDGTLFEDSTQVTDFADEELPEYLATVMKLAQFAGSLPDGMTEEDVISATVEFAEEEGIDLEQLESDLSATGFGESMKKTLH